MEAGAGCVTSHTWQHIGLLSSGCKCQGQKQEEKSGLGDIPTGSAGLCLFWLMEGGGRSVLEVISIIVIVSVRSLMPPRQSLDTFRGHSSKVKGISKDRISERAESHRVIFFVARKEGGKVGAVDCLSGAQCAEY